MKTILLCEPNISEGRDPDRIREIVAGIETAEGVRILHRSSDRDHNRSVFTYAGHAEAVLRATITMAQRAVELIDMAQHHGSHPRMGAVDVVPFVPVSGISTREAVEVARGFGAFMGKLGVPVYYYEAAATCPERTSLPKIRKGEYEALAAKLDDPAWAPDEGPPTFNAKSGATVTGVRPALIAFNVNLSTADLSIAKDIARTVRESSGGLPDVRAIGLRLEQEERVQVSMNLTDYMNTPIEVALAAVRKEAERHGVSVVNTEIIGPVPLNALTGSLNRSLQLRNFVVDQIVETALVE